jgi:hypothetical protein
MGYPYCDGEWWHWSEILNSNYDHTGRLIDSFTQPLTAVTMCDSLGVELDASITTRGDDWYEKQLPDTTALTDSTEVRLNYRDNVKIYSEMASIMHNSGKRLIFVAMPIYKTARKLVSQRQLDEMYQFVRILQRVNPNIEFYDFIDDARYIERDYYNSIHLNNTYGARKFTPILKSIIEKH